jgi:hypothetical protein
MSTNGIWMCPEKRLPYLDIGGHKRYLAALPDKKVRAHLPLFSDTYPDLDESQWQEFDDDDSYLDILDQDGRSSCVGHGAETGFQLAWYQGRGTPHLFSANWIYSLINGGSDNGAVVGDAMDALIKTGACLDSTVPEGNMIFQNQMPPGAMQEASRFKLDTAYRVSTWKSICTAIQLRHPVVFGVDIGRNFAPNKDGFLPQLSGRGGGHCMCARLGMRKMNGQWYIKVQNSWGKDWGKGGICYMPQSYFNGQTDHFVPIAPAVDPQDIHKPPVVHNGLS